MNRRIRARVGKLHPEYEPFDEIMEGDVIWWNRRLRKVREVSYYKDEAVATVTFAILHPSWTDRPHTTYDRAALRLAFGGIAVRGTPLCSNDPLECAVQADIVDLRLHHANALRRVRARDMAGAVL